MAYLSIIICSISLISTILNAIEIRKNNAEIQNQLNQILDTVEEIYDHLNCMQFHKKLN